MNRNISVELTNMCMVYDNNGNVLVEEKVGKNYRGLIFPGGHVESHEAFHDSVVREIKEETGLEIKDPRLVGVKQFFDHNDERYLVFFYVATKFTGTLKASDEGDLTWMTREEIEKSKLAYNFDHDLPIFFDEKLSEHILDGDRDQTY